MLAQGLQNEFVWAEFCNYVCVYVRVSTYAYAVAMCLRIVCKTSFTENTNSFAIISVSSYRYVSVYVYRHVPLLTPTLKIIDGSLPVFNGYAVVNSY
jgi:hypothetical protein